MATATGLVSGAYTVTIAGDTSHTTFWSEDFTSGGIGWVLNVPGAIANGNSHNQWIVNSDASCACGGGNYLHITCSDSSACIACLSQAGTCTYLELPSSFGEGNFTTDVLAPSPTISTIGRANMLLNFSYMCLGLSGTDYGQIKLSADSGNTWVTLPVQYSGVSACSQATVVVPSSYENIPGFKIAFEWINAAGSAGSAGSPPGFVVDNITLSATRSNTCPDTSVFVVPVIANFGLALSSTLANCGTSNGSATAVPSGTGPYSYIWSNGDTTIGISNVAAGTYTVTASIAGQCSASASVMVDSTSGILINLQQADTTICRGDTLQICAPPGYRSYLWTTGDTTQCINATVQGSYAVTATESGNCIDTSNYVSLIIKIPPQLSIAANEDTLVAGAALSYQWYWNNEKQLDANQQIYVAKHTGSYFVDGVDSNQCTSRSVLKDIVFTGIEQAGTSGNIAVYPNPLTAGRWHLSVSNQWIGSVCQVYDAAGRLIYSIPVKGNDTEIDLQIAQGVYLMRIVSDSADYTVKLIKL